VKGNVKQFVRHSYTMKMSKDVDIHAHEAFGHPEEANVEKLGRFG
jgi:hypothetical protein